MEARAETCQHNFQEDLLTIVWERGLRPCLQGKDAAVKPIF